MTSTPNPNNSLADLLLLDVVDVVDVFLAWHEIASKTGILDSLDDTETAWLDCAVGDFTSMEESFIETHGAR